MINTNNDFLWDIPKLNRLKVRKAVKGEKLETLNGTVYANDGDYVIICVNGEKYTCDPNIFKLIYDVVEE